MHYDVLYLRIDTEDVTTTKETTYDFVIPILF